MATDSEALLADPTPAAMSEGMPELLEDEALRTRLGSAAQRLIEREHNYASYLATFNELYNWLSEELQLSE